MADKPILFSDPRVRKCVNKWGHYNGRRFVSRKQGDGGRIWRVE